MDDKRIVELYFERSETAIRETEKKYGKYCHYIAYNILYSEQDAEECVNDTYLAAWESIPPHKPVRLSTFLGKLVRNISLNRYQYDHAQKRTAPPTVILDEVQECIPDPDSDQPLSDEIALRDAINGFMHTLSKKTRIIFVRRYWYFCAIKDIASSLGLSESYVKVSLLRTREKFKSYLEKEGIFI